MPHLSFAPRFLPALVGLLILPLAAPCRSSFADERSTGLAAKDALTLFRVESGLNIELAAAEPLVVAPCALAFDAHGRLFVAENRGYPNGGPNGQPIGRIVRLDDPNHDGEFDQRTDFATGLTFPNGILPWRDGLLVTCAPDLIFLRDTNGDGQADERKVLLTGFSTSGSTQLRVSHPTLALDNWIYVTSGLTGGKVTAPDLPQQPPAELQRTDLRFQLSVDATGQPVVARFEPCDGGSQFGLSFDDFGRRFICYNRVQVQHVVLGSQTLRRNPNLAFSETVQNCPADMSPEPVRGHGAAARLFPLSQNVTTADSHAGTFTAACAVTIWRGAGLPELYRGGVFSCDPTANVVHFDRLDPRGATFAARRIHEGVEFLATPDNWFRPVFLATGPDGALYVCDMYRKTIEHPDYLPVEIRKRTDFESGRTMGRLWRISLSDRALATAARLQSLPLSRLSSEQLVPLLRESEGWFVDTAHRLLLERGPGSVTNQLAALALDPQAPPTAVVRALHLLRAADALTDDLLVRSLQHAAAPVREHAAQFAATRLTADPAWLPRIAPLADDSHPRVRFQTAIALGATTSADAIEPLARIALRDADDRWLRAAALSSTAGREGNFLAALVTHASGNSTGTLDLCFELGRLVGAARPDTERGALVEQIVSRGAADLDQRTALLTGFLEALRARGVGRDAASPLAAITLPDQPTASAKLHELLARSLAIARADDQPVEKRKAALGLLALADFPTVGSALLDLVTPQQPDQVQAGAVRALGLMRDERIAATLLAANRFPAFTPRLRDDVLATLISNQQHLPGVLAAIEAGVVPRGAVDSLRRRQLTEHRDPAIRDRARKLFDTAADVNRAKVYDELKDVVSLTADPIRGQAVFKRACSQCHRLDRDGTPVGPDLFGIRNQPKEAILLHIIIPEHEITPGFAAYVVTTTDGRVLTGLIAAETPTSITLRQALGKEETILRKDIEELSASRLSLMPQELEKTVNRQEFADLLSYLKGERP